jgi:hypothetical protein
MAHEPGGAGANRPVWAVTPRCAFAGAARLPEPPFWAGWRPAAAGR